MATALEDLKPETVNPIQDGQFADFGWRPVFKEHERDGIQFDEAAMRRIANNCNNRIRDTGDFPVISIRHTGKADDPEVVGFAGPFTVRKFGDKKPRYAIYARIRTYAEDAPKLRKYPRLSVEYWADEKDPTNGYFDPISLLGAETPELDLGIRYAKATDGHRVLKYQKVTRFEASTAGGAPNTFIPTTGDETDKPKQNTQYTKEPTLALSPEDIQQIVAALEPVIQESCRMEVKAAMSEPDGDEVPPGSDEQQKVPGMPESAEPAGDDEAAERPSLDEDGGEDAKTKYQAGEENPENEQGAPDEEPMHYGKDGSNLYRAQYQRERLEREQLQIKYQKATAELEAVKQEARIAGRKQTITELADSYVVDVDDEMAFTQDFTDDQFTAHVNRIPTHYQRLPRSFLPIPRAKMDRKTEDQQRKQMLSDRAMAIASRYQKQGKHVEYMACLTEAEEELKKETA